jgi:RNA polymerase sigma factor (sigma-70 family)
MPAKQHQPHEWDELLQIRRNLVKRLSHSGDQTDWQRLFDEHWRAVYHAARRCGLSDSEGEEVVCETILEAGRSVEASRFNAQVCSFKSWLMQLARWQIASRLRSHNSGPLSPGPGATSHGDTDFLFANVTNNLPFETVWEEAWQKNLEHLALERVKEQVPQRDYQIYYLRALKEKRTREVAQLTGSSSFKVYLVHHRLANLVRKELTSLRSQQGWA